MEPEPDHRPSELWETISFNGDKVVADIVNMVSYNQMTSFPHRLTSSAANASQAIRGNGLAARRGWEQATAPRI